MSAPHVLPSTASVPDLPKPTAASRLRDHWLAHAFRAAEIDPTHWDPARGVDVNRQTIGRVYAYYGQLYLRHARLEWAGMANLIGPSFYAGFLDVGFLPDATRRQIARTRRAFGNSRRRLLRQDPLEEPLLGDLGFFETTFLTMQRKIFEDQALMHEAYLEGGLDAIRALGDAGIIDSATVHAWEEIDTGEPALVRTGNRTLLYREQHDIIDCFYVEMTRYSPPSGSLFTYALTLVGSPAIPGAKAYSDVFPLTLAAPLSLHSRLALRTPLAAGNLAVFGNRWQLIERDTLPVYQRLIADRAVEARELIERPIAERMRRFRLLRRSGGLLWTLLTHWQLEIETATTKTAEAGDEVEIDLRTPPTRDGVGMTEASGSLIWANAQRRPFRLTVKLPDGHTFTSKAALVVMLSPDPETRPTRLIAKLPATDLEGARQLLDALASNWRLDTTEIDLWTARAAAATTASHAYSTRVFQAQPIGTVRLEIQVEHHIEQDSYILDALFSWAAPAAPPQHRHAHAVAPT